MLFFFLIRSIPSARDGKKIRHQCAIHIVPKNWVGTRNDALINN